MARPKTWILKKRYHVIDAIGQDIGNYATETAALKIATELDSHGDVVGVFAPHQVRYMETWKGNYDRTDFIKKLHNSTL